MSATTRGTAGGGAKMTLLLVLAVLGLLPLAPATFSVALVFLLPTWVIALTRSFRVPGALETVAGLNIAGTIPALVHLWKGPGDFAAALAIMLDTEFLVTNFAAAGIGIMLLVCAPYIARSWVDIASTRLRRRAEAKRKRLVDEWGEGVTGGALKSPTGKDRPGGG
ncbi:MAG: hypothetical protein VYB54_09420 [Pseudomonadota bacterium]|nr:hypothetical protein [Pseudomonadota bacterium]